MITAAVTPLPERGTDWIIGKNIQMLLVRSDEKQAKLATILGMSPQLLSHKLKGRRPWMAHEIEGAARHFNVTIDSLFKPLLELDSNQQPAGSKTAPTFHVHDLKKEREKRALRARPETPAMARVTPLRIAE